MDVKNRLTDINKTLENIRDDIEFIGSSFIIMICFGIGYYLGTKYAYN